MVKQKTLKEVKTFESNLGIGDTVFCLVSGKKGIVTQVCFASEIMYEYYVCFDHNCYVWKREFELSEEKDWNNNE